MNDNHIERCPHGFASHQCMEGECGARRVRAIAAILADPAHPMYYDMRQAHERESKVAAGSVVLAVEKARSADFPVHPSQGKC